MKTRIKICCISSREEAELAIRSGADALGLVGHMPSGPGVISDESIKKVTESTPPPIATFLLTSETQVEAIIRHWHKVRTNTIQIVDALSYGSYQEIRKALPGVKLVQVIHVMDESSVEEAKSVARDVDAILLDSGNPSLAVKELGGTGKVHNWEISRKIRKTIDIPLFLAGGLKPDNVQEAIRKVAPFGVDICSGVRTHGKLDADKLQRFVSTVHAG
ncbi:phosphoribosylanthranilate isomerase [Catalinimonas alkaloidigena]|uniref:phosphoribosylanthranilate isomerase n=1 Tax=Catalinimonas alkaloidigena TaxID=1075417 RepID=UPI0024052771|nr:phosphoribosylanthranilate isomerase [Catalinimonas alkaloidigena]MDF9800587.1 phosphoribosylanthranilate isomerase [Catalinimonas alkaloidigena]